MHDEVQLLFHELADLSPGERERVFRERQIGSEVRAEVESLLGFDSGTMECLTDCVSSAAEQMLGFSPTRHLSDCGPYRLILLLGSGGMGTVYLAERTDGRFERRAAVKFLSMALATGDSAQRFKHEGSILGRLAHPHIAELLDAGVSENGQPYLVLEYVDGEPVDQYCDHRILDVEARIRLFLDVLAAVAHAHANLIVHRDIKPSNVLVRTDDGQVKLLDFGIAKLLNRTT
jgi:eukaryotic-like serine/threonine-protein kinase